MRLLRAETICVVCRISPQNLKSLHRDGTVARYYGARYDLDQVVQALRLTTCPLCGGLAPASVAAERPSALAEEAP